ncbi:alpha/beta fold hydrolase [Saccharospirillum impatiens]|uniref:alpha/beta fold hydrolase n=1 Tax=Saccharospirillum impatiens TaxID=169438 RepID=UPI0004029D8F|nr:alpha/beta hydrolase [Saccharospirillum impatiens]
MKPTLLLLPGLMCDHRVWAHQVEALSEAWECVVVDYEGDDNLVTMARRVLDQAPDSFAMAGHSMGGRVALEVMRLAAEKVQRLALLDTGYAALADGEAGEKEVAGRMARVKTAHEQGVTAMARDWVTGMVHPDRLNDTALINEIVDMFNRKTPAIFEAQIKALIDRPDATDVLASIDCPTTFIVGRQDAWSTPEQHEAMAERVRHSRLEVIEDAGHMSTMEQPGAMTEVFWQWLS